ncbi:hypothetical protein Sjap_005301 [Stephania japonica]|uniref:Uncharacterized protein n=1 Tax=Stephania japonica TaxID=461633 RepID=A0AAP0K5B9_9MAGN
MSRLHTSLLILIFTVSTTIQASLAAPEEVRDITGKKLLSGVDYYILPAKEVGGLGLGRNKQSYCPLEVVHWEFEGWNGVPVKFLPLNSKKGIVRISTDLNVKFDTDDDDCDEAVWRLSPFDYKVNHYFVTTGGSEGNPGCKTFSNWFLIEKFDDDYKLMFCPSVCKSRKEILCQDIGIEVDGEGKRRLAISSEPFKVKFKKV